MLSKIIELDLNDDKCQEVVVMVYRDDEGKDGVLITGWYEAEDDELIATRFIEMHLDDAQSFVRDYSKVSAKDFIYNHTH